MTQPGIMRFLLARWEWRTATLSVLLIAAEACLVSLVLGLVEAPGAFTAVGAGWIHPLAILAVLLFAAAVPRIAEALQLWSPEYQLFIGGGVVLSLLTMLYACAFAARYAPWDIEWAYQMVQAFIFQRTTATASVLLIAVVTIYAWIRGRVRGLPDLDTAYTTLRVGVVTVAVGAVLTAISDSSDPTAQQQLRPLVVGFFFCALSAVTVARLQMEGLRAQGKLGPQWLGPLVLPVLLVLLIGFFVAALLSRALLEFVAGLLAPVFAVLQFILTVIVAILSFFAYLFYFLFNLILSKFASGDQQANLPLQPPSPRDLFPQGERAVATLPDGVRIALVVAVAALVVYLLTRFLFRKPSRDDRNGEERESVLDWNDLGASLRGAWANLRGRFRKADDPFAALRGNPDWQHTLRIRTLYLRLLNQGKRAGKPRPPADAPREYVPTLGEVFPARDTSLVALTDTYRAARYSDAPATAAEAEAAAASFRAITEAKAGDRAT